MNDLIAVLIFSGLVVLILTAKVALQWRQINRLVSLCEIKDDSLWFADYTISRQKDEIEACWKFINGKPKKGHWDKQKRVKGRFAK